MRRVRAEKHVWQLHYGEYTPNFVILPDRASSIRLALTLILTRRDEGRGTEQNLACTSVYSSCNIDVPRAIYPLSITVCQIPPSIAFDAYIMVGKSSENTVDLVKFVVVDFRAMW